MHTCGSRMMEIGGLGGCGDRVAGGVGNEGKHIIGVMVEAVVRERGSVSGRGVEAAVILEGGGGVGICDNIRM